LRIFNKQKKNHFYYSLIKIKATINLLKEILILLIRKLLLVKEIIIIFLQGLKL
jgi:hypothetical protein